jgi:hypothetical protein
MRAKTVRAVRARKSIGARASKTGGVSKRAVGKEALLNTLARSVGRAAGVIANAAQTLSGETIAAVKKEAFVVKKKTLRKARRKPSASASQKNKNRKTAKATTR